MVSTVKDRHDISDEAKRKILRLNALKLYGWNG
jgi:predicted TIM-barrel fold metal-dependent hydrolase